jgi:hypothetical protein
VHEKIGHFRQSRETVARDHDRGGNLIDRRRFILSTGLLAAGSALGYSMIGCESEFVIPCLGPASAPVPVAGMTYIRASEIGCALNCNLKNGRNKYTGGEATDDGPLINSAMAGATADNPITLIIDGSALISGLFLPAAGHWSIAGLGCGTGFFVKKGTNNDGIHNGSSTAGAPADPGPPVPARGSNVSLSNFTLNGNRGNGRSGDSTNGIRQGNTAGDNWYVGINLMNLDNIVLEKVVVVNTPSYHIRLSNVGNVSASGCVMKSYGESTDGLHFDGPANDITIANCDFTTGDDSIALNCPEGYGGSISRVAVTNCTFNSLSLMRLYTMAYNSNKLTIDTVSVSNCSGTLSEACFLIGLTSDASNPISVASLTISDCNLTAPVVLGVAENFGTIALKNVKFVPSRQGVYWHPPQKNQACAFLRPSPLYGDQSFVGSSLSFDNCTISRQENVEVAGVILENNSVIHSVAFNGFSVQNAKTSSSVPALLDIGSGSIEQLAIESLDSNNMTAVSEVGFSAIGSVTGAGVLATDWRFPDGVMADGVPYVSASSGLPSIKVGGVVEPYTQP